MGSPASKSNSKKKKKLNIDKLYGQVASLFLRHKPSDLTYSDISRFTGVPRPTLYYYFGKSPQKLLQEAGKYALSAFVQIYSVDTHKNYADWDSYQIARLTRAFKFINRYPWAPELYFRYRKSTGVFGESIQEIEEKYFKTIAAAFEHFTGQKPNPYSVRLSSYMKVGILYGLAEEQDMWKLKNQDLYIRPMIQDLHKTLTIVLNQKFKD